MFSWKVITLRASRIVPVLALAIISLACLFPHPTAKAGSAPPEPLPTMEYVKIDKAIELVNNQPGKYEIIVRHPSGDAEQYFLDKRTGKWEMDWHEHAEPL